MSTFKSEHSELTDWYRETLKDAAKLSDESDGYDGSPREIAEQEIDLEYKTRAQALKEKYNKT